MQRDLRRLFFGLEICAPWPDTLPKGRVIEPCYRHMTLAFLGSMPYEDLKQILSQFPDPLLQISPCGWFETSIMLPEKRPRVAAWHAEWFDSSILSFQKALLQWLRDHNLPFEKRPGIWHVTMARLPFNSKEWSESFQKLPFYASAIHLYESLGYSKYSSLWSWPFLVPFEEIEHTADIAFKVYGKDLYNLYVNAFTALAFKSPLLLEDFRQDVHLEAIEDIVILLNDIVSQADQRAGCPFKAVSFHGEMEPFKDNLWQWEMIIDV